MRVTLALTVVGTATAANLRSGRKTLFGAHATDEYHDDSVQAGSCEHNLCSNLQLVWPLHTGQDLIPDVSVVKQWACAAAIQPAENITGQTYYGGDYGGDGSYVDWMPEPNVGDADDGDDGTYGGADPTNDDATSTNLPCYGSSSGWDSLDPALKVGPGSGWGDKHGEEPFEGITMRRSPDWFSGMVDTCVPSGCLSDELVTALCVLCDFGNQTECAACSESYETTCQGVEETLPECDFSDDDDAVSDNNTDS